MEVSTILKILLLNFTYISSIYYIYIPFPTLLQFFNVIFNVFSSAVSTLYCYIALWNENFFVSRLIWEIIAPIIYYLVFIVFFVLIPSYYKILFKRENNHNLCSYIIKISKSSSALLFLFTQPSILNMVLINFKNK
jgi:hypothetical protein